MTVTAVNADEDGALDVGETWLFTGVYAINQTDIDATAFHNVASASGEGPGLLARDLQ